MKEIERKKDKVLDVADPEVLQCVCSTADTFKSFSCCFATKSAFSHPKLSCPVWIHLRTTALCFGVKVKIVCVCVCVCVCRRMEKKKKKILIIIKNYPIVNLILQKHTSSGKFRNKDVLL